MALPDTLNLATVRGDDFSYEVAIGFADHAAYTYEAEIVSAISGSTVAEVTVVATESQVALSMTNVETAAIPRGSYLWRLVATSAEDVRATVREGVFEAV